ncbi:hypothetical protein [Actinoplanes sp. L3-i22]|uniref:hypothetical protein n=1 Tax=Actinoplanes sp. L3-i22 TaxID=2836373 RepID=UPI001C75A299|nr:hypothetical protein [Actinoplanes sp. L3-i22]BCY15607.1 hypothetical protein L3i22_106950 [Actinoplanes sp. L3-i22]
MSSEPPVWLLDVDGVVNAFRAGWYAAPSVVQVYSAADAYDYRIRYEPRLVEAIRRIHVSGQATVTWCTTWCSDAAALEHAFDLPELPRAFNEPVTGTAASQAKLAAAHRVIASGRRLIWTDDVEVDLHAAVCAPWAADGRALLISPNATRGLRTEHLHRIERFLQQP